MSAGRGNLQRATRERLPVHVGEVAVVPRRDRWRWWLVVRIRSCPERGRIVQRANCLVERSDGVQLQAFDYRGFRPIGAGKQQSIEALTPCRGGNGKNASRGMNAPVERQLSEQEHIVYIAPRNDAAGGQHTERNRQIEGGAGLPDVRWSQIDGDAVFGKLETRVPDRAPHSIAALADRRV